MLNEVSKWPTHRLANITLPTCLLGSGHHAIQAEIAKADAAHIEFAHICSRTAAERTSVVFADFELLFSGCLDH